MSHVETRLLGDDTEGMKYPLIAKKRLGGLGRDSCVMEGEAEKAKFIDSCGEVSDYVVQPFAKLVSDKRVYYIGGQMAGVVEREVLLHDDGHVGVKVRGECELKLCEQGAKAFGTGYAGVDLLEDEMGNKWLAEVNLNYFYKGFVRVTGIDLDEMLVKSLL